MEQGVQPGAAAARSAGLSLAGMGALVTGGGGGLGGAIAARLAKDGAAVTIMGRTRATLTEAVGRILRSAGEHAAVHVAVGDALDPVAVAEAMQAAAAPAERLGIVVPVVGGSDVRPLLAFDEAGLLEQLRGNVVSAFLAIRNATPLMAQGGGGSIVCISSTAAATPYPFLTPYGTSKAALEGLVRGAALELAPLGIRVNAVRPGPVRTGAANDHLDDDAAIRRAATDRPLGRLGSPDDVAAAVRYLVGADAAWVTGQVLAVAGGGDLIGAPPYLETLARRHVGDAVVDAALRGDVDPVPTAGELPGQPGMRPASAASIASSPKRLRTSDSR
jgi:NAD(P)-dependent dehydrogenase (short-subunit alcohol dehydrogenase family)